MVSKNKDRGSPRVLFPIGALQFKEPNSREIWGQTLDASDQKSLSNLGISKAPKLDPVYAQTSVTFGKALRWWEKSLQPNMVEISSAQDLVANLMNAGDRLLIVDFYSPGCGGCKALHPKICQIAESNPDSVFLMVNYEQHKEMCYALNVHVLPFFRFYRGAEGRLCSFSCTNATIKKFRDALAKYGTERCSLGPAKGLSEQEMLALASIGHISADLVPNPGGEEAAGKEAAMGNAMSKLGVKDEDNAMVVA